MSEGGLAVERQQSHGTRGGKYIRFHNEDKFLLKDVSILQLDAPEKASPALSPCVQFYRFWGRMASRMFEQNVRANRAKGLEVYRVHAEHRKT
jgi:hypothetical protein